MRAWVHFELLCAVVRDALILFSFLFLRKISNVFSIVLGLYIYNAFKSLLMEKLLGRHFKNIVYCFNKYFFSIYTEEIVERNYRILV